MATPSRRSLFIATLLAAGACAVRVEFYGQAGCPHCFTFMTGALKQVLYSPGLAPSVEFEYFPWGNSYYVTSKCQGAGGYDIMPRKCYDSNCGKNAPAPLPDCFGGELVCQNGPVECDAHKYMACAKQVSGMDWHTYLPFAECIETKFDGNSGGLGLDVSGLATSCATSSGVDSAALSACFGGPDGDAALKAQAMATPSHGFCPVVVVDGEMLEWGKEGNLLTIVCAKLPGPKPSECNIPPLAMPRVLTVVS